MIDNHVIVLCDAFGPTEVLTGFQSWAEAEQYLRGRGYTQDEHRKSKWWCEMVAIAYITEAKPYQSMLRYLQETLDSPSFPNS